MEERNEHDRHGENALVLAAMIVITVVVGLSSTAKPGAGTCAGIDGARAAGLSDQWVEVRSQQDFLKVLDAGSEERKDLC